MNNKLLIVALLGLTSVYGQTPCSHGVLPAASSHVAQYEPVPAAQELLTKEYLPPQAPFDFTLPQANQAAPVYVAPPHHQPALPKLQPVQHTVHQPLPKLQPLPSTVSPVYQPFPSTVKPVYQPLPKFQPLPQVTYKPVVQPIPSTVQPLPKLQPFPSSPRPVISQPLPPSTLKPLAPVPKLAVQPTPTYNRLPALKPIQQISPKQVVPVKSYQPKDNEVPQATNVQTKIARPDLEPAAQTNTFRLANPERLQNIKINHYICEQGDAQQKFLCDLLKLWDYHHHSPPSEIISNDLDNPGDNTNNNPSYATLPTTRAPIPTYQTTRAPIPTYTTTFAPIPTYQTTRAPIPTYTTTSAPIPTTTVRTTPEPEPEEEQPKDTQQNSAIAYLPPYSTTTTTTTTTTTPKPTTQRPSPSNDNIAVIKPEKEGYEYPKPSIPFPVPEKEGYEYPKPSIPFQDGVSFSSFPIVPYNSAPVSLDLRSGISSFANSEQYKPVITSTTIAPDLFFKSNSEFFSSPAFSFNSPSLPASQPAFGQSFFTTTTESPLIKSTVAPIETSTTSASLPANINFQQYYNTLAPASYSVPAYEGSLSAITPSPFNFENSLSGLSSFRYEPLSIHSVSPIETSSPSSIVVPSAAGVSGLFGSQQFGQLFNSPAPSFYYQPLEQSVTTASPLAYNFNISQVAKSNLTGVSSQSLPAQTLSDQPPVNYSFLPQSPSFSSGQVYNFPSSFNSGVPSSSFSSGYPSFFSSGVSSSSFSSDVPASSFNSGLPLSSFNSGLPLSSFSSGVPASFSSGVPSSFSSGIPSTLSSGVSSSSLGSDVPASSFSSGVPLSSFSSGFPSSFSSGFPSSFSSSFPSSFGSGLSQSQSPVTYTSSTPSTFNFQSYSTTQVPQNVQSFSTESSSTSSSSSSTASPVSKSGFFGSQVDSVANLKDLQATAKGLDLDLKFGGPNDNSLFGKEDDDARRKSSSSEKEDISLGNIEILKVKRKSTSQKQ